MASFNPTRPPAGRLSRIGVVIDATQPNRDQIARLCDRAGIGAVWLTERLGFVDQPWSNDVWSDARAVAAELNVAALGMIAGRRGAVADLVERAAEISRSAVSGFELCIEQEEFAAELLPVLRAKLDAAQPQLPIRVSAIVGNVTEVRQLHPYIDDVCLTAWDFGDLETAADEVRARAVEIGRPADTLGVAVMVPLSIGRTEGEASARADNDPVFARLGHPRETGIFGTLEECQDRVIALAHAGVTDLRVILPTTPDVHDVIAQLTAMTIGTTDVLAPGTLRSAAPPPPEGWGGRPDRPPSPRVSGGSRRR